MALTPSQKAAVLYDKNLIIFAGPGSGKTSTSVAKAQRILATGSASLCMVTFTTAAAKEMRHRLEVRLQEAGKPLPKDSFISGTFHSLTLRHYQRYSSTREKLLAPPARSAMLNTMLAGLAPEDKAEAILTLERYQGALNPSKIELGEFHAKFIHNYLEKLKSARAIDLATVMRECTRLMSAGTIPLLPVTHMLGDEMQDADEIQLEFMLIHSRAGVTTTLVADDDQTIYEWRSALGYAGLQRFAAEADAKTITLSENFRSREEIVAHAKRLIAFNDPQRIDKNQQAIRGPGGTAGYIQAADLDRECKQIASTIDRNRRPDETIAVLARTNRSLDAMESALSSYGIPYLREGPSIWDTPEVSSFVALLRGLLSGATADLLPALSLLQVDPLVLKELEYRLGAKCTGFLDGQIPQLDKATAVDIDVIGTFCNSTQRWRKKIRAGEINLVLPDIKHGVKEMLRIHANESETAKRTQRINKLLDAALDILVRLRGTLAQRLGVISRVRQTEQDDTPVRLMTMHSSKGLEFDTVFVIDAKNPDDGSTLMEDHPERRLFYVAITRAKERFAATFSEKPVKYLVESKIPRLNALSELYGVPYTETAEEE